MADTLPERDTIPRLHRIVDHPADQLIGMVEGANTFDDCRVRYGETARRLEAEGRGRVTASRFPEAERNFAPTRDMLQELIRWEAVEPTPVPSARRSLDQYRDRRYELTDTGRLLAEIARRNRSEFTNAVADKLIAAHPYFRRVLELLADRPVSCPIVSAGEVAQGRGGPEGWAKWGADLMGEDADPGAIAHVIREQLNSRFAGRTGYNRPDNKAVAEAMTDAFTAAAFSLRGLAVDGTTMKTIKRWGSELLLFDQSNYVPGHASATVLWSACDLRTVDGVLRARRRGRAEHGERVAQALVRAYAEQDRGDRPGITLPVHEVRAQAAFESRVTRELCSLVLSDIVDGLHPQLGVQALPFIGSCRLPDSEPAFRHRGRIRLEIQMVPQGTEPERSNI